MRDRAGEEGVEEGKKDDMHNCSKRTARRRNG